MKHAVFSICTVLLLTVFSANGQDKYEHESRLKIENVSEKAIRFVEKLSLEGKIKWYLEKGINTSSIEAKSKFERRNISVEFDTLGTVEDIEIEIPWKHVADDVRQRMAKHLEAVFTKYDVRKVQIQFLGDEKTLISISKDKFKVTDTSHNYEIILKGVTDDSVELYEFLFSGDGDFMQKAKIIFRNIDNLQF